jgi:hypothetical protein
LGYGFRLGLLLGRGVKLVPPDRCGNLRSSCRAGRVCSRAFVLRNVFRLGLWALSRIPQRSVDPIEAKQDASPHRQQHEEVYEEGHSRGSQAESRLSASNASGRREFLGAEA